MGQGNQVWLKTTILIIVLLGLTAPALSADKWNTTDKVLVSTMWSARMIDMAQTIEIYDNPLYEEVGPVVKHIGEDAVVPWFIGTAIVMHYIAHVLPGKWRTPFMIGINVGSWIPIIHNRRIGIKIQF